MSKNILDHRSHPWHGVFLGEQAPEIVNCYIEMVPTDTIKYELDKESGILKVDRPQKYSSLCPTLYGLLPQTYCGKHIAKRCMERTGLKSISGDGDPLDICVITEKVIPRGDLILKAVPIGGLRLIDGNEADDKIIAVLQGDFVHGSYKELTNCPEEFVERICHYFLTYKDYPDTENRKVDIKNVYNAKEAKEVINLSRKDYEDKFSNSNS